MTETCSSALQFTFRQTDLSDYEEVCPPSLFFVCVKFPKKIIFELTLPFLRTTHDVAYFWGPNKPANQAETQNFMLYFWIMRILRILSVLSFRSTFFPVLVLGLRLDRLDGICSHRSLIHTMWRETIGFSVATFSEVVGTPEAHQRGFRPTPEAGFGVRGFPCPERPSGLKSILWNEFTTHRKGERVTQQPIRIQQPSAGGSLHPSYSKMRHHPCPRPWAEVSVFFVVRLCW